MRQEAPKSSSGLQGRAGAEEAYRLLAECATEYAAFTLDAQGRVAGWNAGAERLLGYPAAEVVGLPYSRFFTIEDVERGRPEQELRTAATAGRYDEELWQVRRGGSRLWAAVTTRPLRDEQGGLRGFARVVGDRTELQSAAEARFRLSGIVESSEDAILGLTLDGFIASWNAGAERLYGYPAVAAVGKPVSILVPPDQLHELLHTLDGVRKGLPVEPYESLGVRRDGSRFHVAVTISPVKDGTGKVVAASAIARDISSRKQAEEIQGRLARQAVLRADVALALAERDRPSRHTLQRCAEALVRNFGAAYAQIWVHEPGSSVLRLRAGASDDPDGRVPPGALQVVPIAVKRRPHLSNDAANDPCVSNKEWAAQDGIVAFAGYPLLVGERLVGVVALASRKPFPDGALGLVGSVTDALAQGIERRRAEEELRESERRFRELAETIHEVFWLMGAGPGELLYVSPAYERIWGRSCQSLYDNPLSFVEAVHPDDRKRVEEEIRRQFHGEPTDHEYRVVRPDGSVRWVHDHGFPIRDEAGHVYRVAGVAEDVTERKQTEQERAELLTREQQARTQAEAAERRARFLAQAGAALASSLDYETTLASVARLAVPRVADWCSVELVGEDGSLRQLAVTHVDSAKVALAREWRRRYPPDPDAARGVANVLRTQRVELFGEVSEELLDDFVRDAEERELLRRLGVKSLMTVPLVARERTLGAISLVLGESGRRYGLQDLALAEGLAQRAALAIDNARLYRELQETDRRKDEFLALLGHELRNPLAPIRNALHLLQMRGVDPGEAARVYAMMERQIQQMVRLVDDLLDVSRVTRGKIRLRREPVDLAEVLNRAVETSRPLIEARGHTLELDLPSGPVPLEADTARLAQVLTNLLNNAAKYTEDGGYIWLSATLVGEEGEAPGEVVLRVRDTGVGISPEVLPHIFEPFTQAERSLDRSLGGLGIGLSLARSLVELHGGRISAHSRGLGQGSEFTVRLPLSQFAAAHAEGSPPSEAEVPRSSRRVLIVDDNVDAAESLAMLLRLTGHEAQTAYDGAAALEAARTFRPGLILLDIGLPNGVSGYEVARQLRQEPGLERVVVAALTGYGQEDDRRLAREAGFDHFLTKPVEPAVLRQLLTTPVETVPGV